MSVQYQALLSEGASAIRRFDEAQRKIEEDKRRQEQTQRELRNAPERGATAAVPAEAAASRFDGTWSLTLVPTSGPSRLCSRGQSLRLNVNKTFSPTPAGPVFISEAGNVSGTLTLDDGTGFKGQVVLRGSIAGTAGSGQMTGICPGTFSISR